MIRQPQAGTRHPSLAGRARSWHTGSSVVAHVAKSSGYSYWHAGVS
jgi:hypothetical protein